MTVIVFVLTLDEIDGVSQIMPKIKKESTITSNINLQHYEHGILINFEEAEVSQEIAFLTLNKNNQLYRHDMKKISPFHHSSDIFSPKYLDHVNDQFC